MTNEKVLLLIYHPSCGICDWPDDKTKITAVWRAFVGPPGYQEPGKQWIEDCVGYCHRCNEIVPVILDGKVVE